jgi:spore photoproduct lyase
MPCLSLIEHSYPAYQPKRAPHFEPAEIIITKGSLRTQQQRDLAAAICAAYPNAKITERLNLAHNRVELKGPDPLDMHYRGKKTLVLGIHKSAVRCSDEDRNNCPTYWHFSPYGFCPYDCQYCYLAGTPGVKYSPTVKIFLNLPDILDEIDRVASHLAEPTAFYLGKLQDGLALDPLTGYSRTIIPFFTQQEHARLTLLTKSSHVENLLDLDHRGHTILSWSLNPPEVCSAFEKNVSSPGERIAAMRQCAGAGYPLRAVIMPVIPIEGWQSRYTEFLKFLIASVPLRRITLGQICSFPAALRLTERKLGLANPVSNLAEKSKSWDGRFRFPFNVRVDVYRYLIDTISQLEPHVQIGLCMEEPAMFKVLNMESAVGGCNCVL